MVKKAVVFLVGFTVAIGLMFLARQPACPRPDQMDRPHYEYYRPQPERWQPERFQHDQIQREPLRGPGPELPPDKIILPDPNQKPV